MNFRSRIRSFILPLIPESVYSGVLVRRRISLIRQTGIIFIHIPKNGGTSINAALYGQFMGHYKARYVQQWAPDCWTRLPSFAITRNPWDRLWSAYRFVRSDRLQNTLGAQGVLRPERYRTECFQTFESFVHTWLPDRELEREDPVFHSQESYVIGNDGKLSVSYLGRMEALDDVRQYLESVLERKISIGHYNRSTNSSDYRSAYTPRMRDIVAQVYAGDIARFGYDF